MLRLGVAGGIEEHWRDAARRLRGAALDPDAAPSCCDAVVLLTAEADDVDRLLALGKHVLLADETALSKERLAAWSARFDGPLLAVKNRDHYLPSHQLIRGLLDQHLGAPGLVRIHRWTATLTRAHLLRDLDLVLRLMGRPPRVVSAMGWPDLSQSWPNPSQVHLGFDGGAMALIAHAGGPLFEAGYSSLHVIAANGAAYADDQANQQLFFGRHTHAVRTVAWVQALTAMVQAFIDDVGTGRRDLLTGWRQVLAVRDAIADSQSTRRAVTLERD